MAICAHIQFDASGTAVAWAKAVGACRGYATGASLAMVLGIFAAGEAQAGEWRVVPGIGITESFTDNNGLVTDDEAHEPELTTSLIPSVQVTGTGGRVSLNLSYNLEQVYFLRQKGREERRQTLQAVGQAEVWEKQAFINTNASITRSAIASGVPVSSSVANAEVNTTEVRSLTLTPTFLHHFGNWAETTSTNEFSWVQPQTEEASDTFTSRATFFMNSGRRFSQFLWSASAEQSKTTRESDAPATRTRTGNADLTYVVNRHLSLLGGLGYEQIEDGSLGNQPNGLIWNVGASLRGARSSLTVNYNDRFDTQFVSFDGDYRISDRTVVTASLSQSLQSSQSLVSSGGGFLGTDDQGNVIDTRTGQPFDPNTPGFGIGGDALFMQRRFQIGLSGARGRNSYSGQIFWESRDTESTGTVQISTGGTLSFSRSLTPKLSMSLGMNYNSTDLDDEDGRIEDQLSFSASLDMRLIKDVSSSISYNHLRQRSNIGDADVTENSVLLNLSRQF